MLIVFLYAERLASPEIDKLLRDDRFRRDLVLLGIDEAHLLVPWGKEFWKAYHQISLLRAWFMLVCSCNSICNPVLFSQASGVPGGIKKVTT